MKQRQVSIELLRIVAMLMVLTLHANFMAFGKPTSSSALSADGILRTMLQSFSVCAVNVFVMISGWFGIRATIKGFANFMWQVFYFVGLAYLIFYVVNDTPITFKNALSLFGLYNGGGWFVASYIGLYIISPVLNSFLSPPHYLTHKKSAFYILVAFFAFELLWGNTLSAGFVLSGYSTFSFIGIYLLAGLLKRINLKVSSLMAFLVFIGCTLLNSVLYIIATRLNLVAITPILFNYINPLVIASSASLLLAFAKMPDIKSNFMRKVILWVGSSCFAAYLLHVGTPASFSAYLEAVQQIYTGHTQILGSLLVAIFVFSVFLLAVLLDQPRKLIWNYLIKPFFNK